MRNLPVVIVLLLAACESDEQKVQRLSRELLRARIAHESYTEKFDSLFRHEKDIGGQGLTGPLTDAYADSAVQAKNRLMLAERELTKFMDGR